MSPTEYICLPMQGGYQRVFLYCISSEWSLPEYLQLNRVTKKKKKSAHTYAETTDFQIALLVPFSKIINKDLQIFADKAELVWLYAVLQNAKIWHKIHLTALFSFKKKNWIQMYNLSQHIYLWIEGCSIKVNPAWKQTKQMWL